MGGTGSGPRSAPTAVKRAKGRSAGRDSGGRKLPEPVLVAATPAPAVEAEAGATLTVLPGGEDRTPELPDSLEEDGPGAARWARTWRDAAWLHVDFDRDAVLRLCEAEDARKVIREEILSDGVMIPGSMGQSRAHPLISQQRAIEAAMLGLERELGLTPAARSSLGVGERQEEKTSALLTIMAAAAARSGSRRS